MPQTGIATNAPVLVSTCAVSDLYNSASIAEFGPPISYRLLQLSFLNTDESAATQLTFDIVRDGTHTMVTDRGRFSRGVMIDRVFDGGGAYGSGRTQCSVASITFADGHKWAAAPQTTANR